MNKWDLMFLMQDGVTISGTYTGPEDNAKAVADKLLIGDIDHFVGVDSLIDDTTVFVRYGDIQACYINPWKEKENGCF